MCRCSASLTAGGCCERGGGGGGGSGSESATYSEGFDSEEYPEDVDSTYAFSTLDSDFIAWMRLSVKDVDVTRACYMPRQCDSLAILTQQELAKIVNIFNTNHMGLQMSLVSRFETPTLRKLTMLKLLDLMGCPVDFNTCYIGKI